MNVHFFILFSVVLIWLLVVERYHRTLGLSNSDSTKYMQITLYIDKFSQELNVVDLTSGISPESSTKIIIPQNLKLPFPEI